MKTIIRILIILITIYGENIMAMELQSNSFNHGDLIPTQYTCDGKDISPELHWHDIPENTQSFVLIMDDPDAPMGTWDHWLLFNISGDTSRLDEDIQELPPGTVVGRNSWGRQDYGGPCPPSGLHRYQFKLYSLDTILHLPTGSDKTTIEHAMKGHILAMAELMGKYKR